MLDCSYNVLSLEDADQSLSQTRRKDIRISVCARESMTKITLWPPAIRNFVNIIINLYALTSGVNGLLLLLTDHSTATR